MANPFYGQNKADDAVDWAKNACSGDAFGTVEVAGDNEQYGTAANRMRMRNVECRQLLLWAIRQGSTRTRKDRINQIIAWWRGSEMLRSALPPLRARLRRIAWVRDVWWCGVQCQSVNVSFM